MFNVKKGSVFKVWELWLSQCTLQLTKKEAVVCDDCHTDLAPWACIPRLIWSQTDLGWNPVLLWANHITSLSSGPSAKCV